MFQFAIRSAKFGALYVGITSLFAGIGLSLFWEGVGDGFIMLLLVWVPFLAIAGLAIGFVLYLVVGFVVGSVPSFRNMPIVSFAVIGGMVSLIPLLIFASVGAGISPIDALAGTKGSYLALVPGIIAATVAGIFVGRKFDL